MALARQIASLGLGARGSANIKVRQPLARVLVNVGQAVSLSHKELSDELTAIVVDELNVKKLEFVAEAGELVTYRILPNLKLLGPKLGKQLPAVRQVIEAANPAELAAKVRAGENVVLQLPKSSELSGSSTVELSAEELLIQTQPAEGLAVAADKVITVGIDVIINDELAAEGLARELVRRIQNMRKDAGFEIADKIVIYYQAEGAVHRVFKAWADYIKAETLAVEIDHQLIPEAAFQRKEKVDGLDVMLGVKRVG
jgi:isoleucyl-tRNA synthetase